MMVFRGQSQREPLLDELEQHRRRRRLCVHPEKAIDLGKRKLRMVNCEKLGYIYIRADYSENILLARWL